MKLLLIENSLQIRGALDDIMELGLKSGKK